MSIETDYEPKYIDLEDVPLSGPDDYSSEDKRKAIYQAETKLELDVNSGEAIQQSEVIEAHRAAVMNYATHVLTHSAEDPSDVTLGDMQDGGGTITDYSSDYLQHYHDLVDQINSSGVGSSNYGNFSVAVNYDEDAL